jgi:hypothetical protein
MNLPERLFVFSYLLTQKFDPISAAPHQVACLSLSLLSTLNLITLVNLGAVIFPRSAIVPSNGAYILILGAGTLLFWLVLFVRNRRYASLIADYEDLSALEKRGVWVLGYSHVILSFVLVVASFIPFVD